MKSVSNINKQKDEKQVEIKIESEVIDIYKNELQKSKREVFNLDNKKRKRNKQCKNIIHLNNSLIRKLKKHESNENVLNTEIKNLKELLRVKESRFTKMEEEYQHLKNDKFELKKQFEKIFESNLKIQRSLEEEINLMISRENSFILKLKKLKKNNLDETEKNKFIINESEKKNLKNIEKIEELKGEIEKMKLYFNSKFQNIESIKNEKIAELISANKSTRSDLHKIKKSYLENINQIHSEYKQLINQVNSGYESTYNQLKSDWEKAKIELVEAKLQANQIKTQLNETIFNQNFFINLLKDENNFLLNQ